MGEIIKLYNTLTRRKQIFKPLNNGIVRIYTCGPTVYNYAHIGNLSVYLFSDLLKRYLNYSGYNVIDVMNFTDVDDKTIKAAREAKISLNKLTTFYSKAIIDDFAKLNIIKPQTICKATEHVSEMIKLIQKLLKKGYAYKSNDKSVYFKVSAFSGYGKFAAIDKKK